MTATQIVTVLTIVEALTPTLQLLSQGIKDMTGKDVDIESMTISELLELKSELEATHPDNWPDFKFKTPE